MSHLITDVFSLLCPWLALVRCLQFLATRCGLDRRGLARFIVLSVLGFGVLAVPLRGFTLAWWIRGFEANFSIPFTVLLACGVLEVEFRRSLLTNRETLTGWIFGLTGSILLYPFALGWGDFDPYQWGWFFSPLFIASAALSALLIWRQNRFGLALLLAIIAWQLHLLESRNY